MESKIILPVFLVAFVAVLSACTATYERDEAQKSSPASGFVVDDKPSLDKVQMIGNGTSTGSKESVGPKLTETPKSDISQKVEKELVKRTDKGITLKLYNVTYEIRGEDYAVINGLRFGVENKGTETIDAVIFVYLWDENDKPENKYDIRAEIPLDTLFGTLGRGEAVTQTALVKVPFNDISLNKTLNVALTETFSYNPKTYVSVDYLFNISKLSKS